MSVFFLESILCQYYIFSWNSHHSNEYQPTILFLNLVLTCGFVKYLNLTCNIFPQKAPCKSILIWPICFGEKFLGLVGKRLWIFLCNIFPYLKTHEWNKATGPHRIIYILIRWHSRLEKKEGLWKLPGLPSSVIQSQLLSFLGLCSLISQTPRAIMGIKWDMSTKNLPQ